MEPHNNQQFGIDFNDDQDEEFYLWRTILLQCKGDKGTSQPCGSTQL